MSPEEQRWQRRIDEDMAPRLRDGAWGHPWCLALTALTTTLPSDHPLAMVALTLAFGIQTALRLRFTTKSSLEYCLADAGRSKLWRCGMLTMVMSTAALWGGLLAWICGSYGFHHANTMALTMYYAAITASGTPILAFSPGLARLYVAILSAPLMTANCLFPDGPILAPLAGVGSYWLFMSIRAQRQHGEYMERLAADRELIASANQDPLTGLSNRLAMRRALTREIERARADSGRLALLFIDLDGFKAVNDGCSHCVGDQVLCEVGKRLAECAGSAEHVSRFGGDEFTLLLTDRELRGDRENALGIAECAIAALGRPMRIDGYVCTVGASIGISFFPDDAKSEDELERAADHAMYEAKRTGTNQICRAGSRRTHEARQVRSLSHLAEAINPPVLAGASVVNGVVVTSVVNN